MKCSLGICNFLEEISSLSHSVVFCYFFALITEEVLEMPHLINTSFRIGLYICILATVGIGPYGDIVLSHFYTPFSSLDYFSCPYLID